MDARRKSWRQVSSLGCVLRTVLRRAIRDPADAGREEGTRLPGPVSVRSRRPVLVLRQISYSVPFISHIDRKTRIYVLTVTSSLLLEVAASILRFNCLSLTP